MVARDRHKAGRRTAGLAATLEQLMESWRIVLGTTGQTAAEASVRATIPVRAVIAQSAAVLRSGTTEPDRARSIVIAGAGTYVAFAAASVAVAGYQGRLAAGLGAVVIGATWLAVRLMVMLILDNERSVRSRSASIASWASGILLFALAVVPVLRGVAWATSLWLTYRVMARGTTREASKALMLRVSAFEVGAIVLIWLARNLTVAAVLLGS